MQSRKNTIFTLTGKNHAYLKFQTVTRYLIQNSVSKEKISKDKIYFLQHLHK